MPRRMAALIAAGVRHTKYKSSSHSDPDGLIWSAESCNVSFIDGRTLYHKRKKLKNSLSLVYEGDDFKHSCFIFLAMDVDVLRLVHKYK